MKEKKKEMVVTTTAYCEPMLDVPKSPSSLPTIQTLSDAMGWEVRDWSSFVASLPPIDDKKPPRRVKEDAFLDACKSVSERMKERLLEAGQDPGSVLTSGHKGSAYARKLGRSKKVVCVGDIHSSIHALMQTVDAMHRSGILSSTMKLQEGTTLIFLGDIVNRGPYNMPCLMLVFVLLLHNDCAHAICGNHEGMDLWGTKSRMSSTLAEELKKLPDSKTAIECVASSLQLLPTALFVRIGSEMVQFNHAGIDPVLAGGDYLDRVTQGGKTCVPIDWTRGHANVLLHFLEGEERVLLLDERNSTCNGDSLRRGGERSEATDEHLFKWGDLGGFGDEAVLDDESGRWEFGRVAVKQYLKRTGLARMVGGHQDLVHLGVFGEHKGTSEVFDLSVPPCGPKTRIGKYMALKTSIAWESKPGDILANCYVVLEEEEEPPAATLPVAPPPAPYPPVAQPPAQPPPAASTSSQCQGPCLPHCGEETINPLWIVAGVAVALACLAIGRALSKTWGKVVAVLLLLVAAFVVLIRFLRF